ncbi:MAG: hypothetical protein ACR2QC_01490 [Gammaproteobacteria bacterium]
MTTTKVNENALKLSSYLELLTTELIRDGIQSEYKVLGQIWFWMQEICGTCSRELATRVAKRLIQQVKVARLKNQNMLTDVIL